MAKKQHDELEFGSDSFLDVVANIVGILIILIVVAGVRVSQAPTPRDIEAVVAEQAGVEPVMTAADVNVIVSDDPINVPIVMDQPEPEQPPPPEVFAPLPEVNAPQQIIAKVDELNERNRFMAEELRTIETSSERMLAKERMTTADVQKLRKELSLTANQLREQRELLSVAQQVALENEETVALLRRKVDSAALSKPEKETLQHQLPPIGKVVTGKEIHFRLINNQISHVPIDHLADRMQRDIERRKDVIMSRQHFRGTAGPLEGYELTYVIQRQSMSLFEEARTGRAVFRMGITGWVIEPQPSLVTETYEEATRLNSRFRSAILSAGSSATVTFWVYQDSFEIHQQLKRYLHDTGFWVASRPLPDGVPIAGSPSGSKSFAQ